MSFSSNASAENKIDLIQKFDDEENENSRITKNSESRGKINFEEKEFVYNIYS